MINNNTQPNSNLKPTMTSSYELGLELKFFNGRLGIDFTYYNQISKDQIIALASSSASGYASRLVNAGKIQNKGIELAVNGRVLQIKDFAWGRRYQLLKELEQGPRTCRRHGLSSVG